MGMNRGQHNKHEWHIARSTQFVPDLRRSIMNIFLGLVILLHLSFAQVQKSSLDFSQAVKDPETGALCVMQEVCIADLEALASQLPPGPCVQQDANCTCATDADCGGGSAK